MSGSLTDSSDCVIIDADEEDYLALDESDLVFLDERARAIQEELGQLTPEQRVAHARQLIARTKKKEEGL